MDIIVRRVEGGNVTDKKIGAFDIPQHLYEPNKHISIGRVITTFGSPAWIHLQLETHRRTDPDIPVLVFDDCSPCQQSLIDICTKYGACYESTNTRMLHVLGDMCGTYRGLEWATGRFDILLKTSRRWVITKPWAESLRNLANTTQMATFSGYATDINFGFRTECFGMHVPSWQKAKEQIKKAVIDRDGQFVEGYMHGFTMEMYHNRCALARVCTDAQGVEGHGSSTYAVWRDMLGTAKHVRQDVPLGVLWGGGWHTPADIAVYAQSIGLPYTAQDFDVRSRSEI